MRKEGKKEEEEEEEDDMEMCRLSNRALECDINKAMHVGSGGTWQWSFLEASLFINIQTHLFIYNKTPKFEYLYYDIFKTLY